MMTQADILGQNEEMRTYSEEGNKKESTDENENKEKLSKPKDFGPSQLGDFNVAAILGLNENSPIKPSKYFATDSALNQSKGLRNIIIGGMIFSTIITVALIIQISIGTNQVPYRIGIVTQEKVCSDIGSEMVRKGGKSIDAFIASSLCLSVVNPFSSGLGAGGFLLLRDHKHDRNFAFNCFFKSSQGLSLSDYTNRPDKGVDSIAVPGEFKCLQYAYKYAKFYWKVLAAPAIKLARDGFQVSKNLANHLQDLSIDEINSDPIMAEIFIQNGTIVKENQIIKNTRLADTLDALVKNENEFYDGKISLSIVEQLSEGSKQQLNLNDLKQYDAIHDNAISIANYQDFEILTSNFPSNGPILKFILETMATLKLKKEDLEKTNFYKKLLEVTKLGYLMSSYIGDPQFDLKLNDLYSEKLTLSKKYIESLDDPASSTSNYPFLSSANMSLSDSLVLNFVSANDHNDYMLSYVSTLGSSWGSRKMTKEGFILNNGLDLFSYNNPSDSGNLINAGKQPRGFITPILTFSKKSPCVNRYSISYGHHGLNIDDFGLTELSDVILKLFTDVSYYDKVDTLSDKRVQFAYQSNVCYEDGFDSTIIGEINDQGNFLQTNSCSFHSIDLIMKKDQYVYSQVDARSNDESVIFNEK